MPTATYTAAGAKATTPAKLDKAVFGVEVTNHELLKSAYVSYLANSRINLAKVKTRGEVIGSNIKPWRQKGTGRARFGSRYNPIWRGGGIVFGPTGEENYSKKLNTQAKRLAVRQALSLAAQSDKVSVIESIVSKNGKTSEIASLLKKLGLKRNVLIIVQKQSPEVQRASANISSIKVASALYVNVYDVLNADHILFEDAALKLTSEWLTTKDKLTHSDQEAK